MTDELIRQRGDQCGTLSSEFWHSMTSAQQEELVEIRKRRVSDAADRTAWVPSLKNLSDEAIRDLYFAIPDKAARIKRIDDLCNYESARRSHDGAMVLEAYYRYDGFRRTLLAGCGDGLNSGGSFLPWRFSM